MALSDEQIAQLSLEWPAETNDLASHIDFARAIEAEVQKQDTALIRQMLDVLEWQERPLCMCWAGCGDCNPENAPNAVAAIAAALKRLDSNP